MDTKKSTAKEFLSQPNVFFQIPVYQRNFCWKTEQCRMLFDDIYRCLETGRRHFIGTVVYKAEQDGNDIIIDGQQRITSLMLLLKALYDTTEDESLRRDIQEHYLLNPCGDEKYKLKLKPIQRDAGVYKRLLSHLHVEENQFTEYEMSTPLYLAFMNYRVWIKEMLEVENFDRKLMDTIEQLELIEISVTDENPQEIFESINATGMPLTNTDILRNYLLMSIPYKEQVRIYNSYWLPMEEAITTEEVENFVTSYLVLKKKSANMVINGKKWAVSPAAICTLFRHCYDDVSDVEVVESLFSDMYNCAKHYARCVYRKSTAVDGLNEIDACLYELFYLLKCEQWAPVIMYVLNDLSLGTIGTDDCVAMLRALISFSFRSKVVGGHPCSYGQAAGILIKLDKGREQYVQTFISALCSGHGESAFPSDLSFENALLRPQTIRLNAAGYKYLLYCIEKYLNPTQPNAMSAGTIEHVMPQTLSDSWKKYLAFNGDTPYYHDLLDSLGNLTLSECNSSMSNKPFAEKQAAYAESLFSITTMLANEVTWTKSAIERRGRKLMDAALNIWKSYRIQAVVQDSVEKHSLNEDMTLLGDGHPASYSFLGEEVPCNSWTAIGVGVVSILYFMEPEVVQGLCDSQRLPADGFLSANSDDHRQTSRIADGLWLNQAKNPRALLKQLKTFLSLCSGANHSLIDEFWFTLEDEQNGDEAFSLK